MRFDQKHIYKTGGSLRPKLPDFNWGGLIVIVLMILAIAGMAIYQSYFGSESDENEKQKGSIDVYLEYTNSIYDGTI